MKLTANFSSEEFACKDGCGFDKINIKLVNLLQEVRDYFKSPVMINSGCRCEKHNKESGGAPGSQHVKGNAADIVVKDHTPSEVYSYLYDRLTKEHPNTFGLGLYSSWVHIDVRETGKWRSES